MWRLIKWVTYVFAVVIYGLSQFVRVLKEKNV